MQGDWYAKGDDFAIDPISQVDRKYKVLSEYKGWRIAWTGWIPPHDEFGISAHVIAFDPILGDRGLLVTLPDFRMGTYMEGDTLPEPFGAALKLDDNGTILPPDGDPDAKDRPMATLDDLQRVGFKKAMESVEQYIAGRYPNQERLIVGKEFKKPEPTSLGYGYISREAATAFEKRQRVENAYLRKQQRRLGFKIKKLLHSIGQLWENAVHPKRVADRKIGVLERKINDGWK